MQFFLLQFFFSCYLVHGGKTENHGKKLKQLNDMVKSLVPSWT